MVKDYKIDKYSLTVKFGITLIFIIYALSNESFRETLRLVFGQ